MSKNTNEAKAPAAAKPSKEPALYAELDRLTNEALARGDHSAYSTLHAVQVQLAGAKYAASHAEHGHDLDEEAVSLLAKIKAL